MSDSEEERKKKAEERREKAERRKKRVLNRKVPKLGRKLVVIKNKDKEQVYSGMPPCITARIDRFMLSRGGFTVTKMEVFNDLTDINRRNEYAQTEASNLSDHYAMAIEVRPRAALKRGETRTFTNVMFDIERSPEEEWRHAQCELQMETEEPIQEEQEPN